MLRLSWLTDIHLNFIDADAIDQLAEAAAAGADAVAVSGDIAEADSLAPLFGRFIERAAVPVYWVLGNHDFYGGSIAQVRAVAKQMPGYLPAVGPVDLGDGVALAGHDGWGDARLGNYPGTPVYLNDFVRIRDFISLDRRQLGDRLGRLGDEGAQIARRVLQRVAEDGYRKVFWVTHVPPFRAACWHQGQVSNDDWLPFFTCKAMGDALLEVAREHPELEIVVLCGHTHSGGVAQVAENLTVYTGAAEYTEPAVQRVFCDG